MMSLGEAILLCVVVYCGVLASIVLLYRRYRLRKADENWQRWQRQNSGRVFAWRMLFGSLPTPRLMDKTRQKNGPGNRD